MTHAEFIELVRKMREAQINYFKSRDKWQLEKSKSFERQVDKALTGQIEDEPKPVKQDSLWP